MKKSFLGSVSLHAMIVIFALFGLPKTKPFEIQPVEAIQVDISNITDSTKVKAQTKSDEKPTEKPKPKASKSPEKAKPQEKVTEEKKVAAKEPSKAEPPPPEPEKKVEEKPVEKPVEKKVEDAPVDPDPLKDLLAAEDAQLKKAEEQKKKDEEKKQKAEEKKKKAEDEKKKKIEAAEKAAADAKKKAEAEKKKPKLDVAQLEDLLNKENTESSAPVEKKDESGTPEKAEKDMQGTDDAMSATIIDGLRQRFNDCWDVPPSVRESKETVDLSWQMDQQGKVVGQPVVVGGNGGGTAQQAAIAAVMACAPYDWLPQEHYKLWKEIEWTFAPR